jgi:hypothetical protein
MACTFVNLFGFCTLAGLTEYGMPLLTQSRETLAANKTTRMILRRFSSMLIILFVYAACNNRSANIDLQNEKEVHKVLATTWEAEYMETMGSRNKMPDNMITHVVLNKNGTYTVGVKNGVIKRKGIWSYDSKTHDLNMGIEKENVPSRILKLTDNELVRSEYMTLNGEIMDSTVVTYKKL